MHAFPAKLQAGAQSPPGSSSWLLLQPALSSKGNQDNRFFVSTSYFYKNK